MTKGNKMKPVLSYHSDHEFKRDFVRMVKLHREQDRYISGSFSNLEALATASVEDNFKGCSVGCSIHSLKLLGRNGMEYNDHVVGAVEVVGVIGGGIRGGICYLQK